MSKNVKINFRLVFLIFFLMRLNSGAPIKWWHKIKHPFKLLPFNNNSLLFQCGRWTNLIPGCRNIDQLHFSGGQVVLKHSVFFFQQEILQNTTHIYNSISLFGINYKSIQARLSQPPSKRTSIFLTRASVSYHIWMEPGSWRVRVIRSTMQYEAVVKIRRRMMPLLSACGTMADTMTKMAEKK